MGQKFVGITRVTDARAAVRFGADAIGINFVPTSRPFFAVATMPVPSSRLLTQISRFTVSLLISRREDIEEVLEATGVRGVQLHGQESADEARGWDRPVIKAVAAARSCDVDAAFKDAADQWRVLVDHPRGGGSGQRVDESVLDGLELGSAILAGGLAPGNVRDVVERYQPFGVDTAGGVEEAPGVKSHERIEEFVRHARATR